jgi:predicted DNA-binding transcriptional regulator AlpA
MKSRPTQLGVRENPASSRQHVSRLAVDTHSNATCIEEESPQIQRLSFQNGAPGTNMPDPYRAASLSAATAEERRGERNLLTVHEVAELLQVPVSWVYERTRRHGPEQLPHFKIGKYLRFEERILVEFIQRQRCA